MISQKLSALPYIADIQRLDNKMQSEIIAMNGANLIGQLLVGISGRWVCVQNARSHGATRPCPLSP